ASGIITALEYDVIATGGIDPKLDFSISLGTTLDNSATGTYVPNNLMTEVYSSASEAFPVGTKTITFDTPYIWDGLGNLVVQVTSNSGAYSTNYGILSSHTVSPNMTTYTQADSQPTSYFINAATGTTITGRPDTTFIGEFGCSSLMVEVPVIVEPK